jgi:hypothetical protein
LICSVAIASRNVAFLDISNVKKFFNIVLNICLCVQGMNVAEVVVLLAAGAMKVEGGMIKLLLAGATEVEGDMTKLLLVGVDMKAEGDMTKLLLGGVDMKVEGGMEGHGEE